MAPHAEHSAPPAPLADADEEHRKHKAKNADFDRQLELAKKADPNKGLTDAEAEVLRAEYGLNELEEKKVNPFLMFLGYLWGPMPIMIWAAIIIELVKAILVGEGWEDFAVLTFLQFANATVGYIEERNAGDAIAALKQQLAPQCHVCRDGVWQNMHARLLVPGDVIELKIGDVIPADAVLLEGQPVQVDQAALTGESLPVTVHPYGQVLMGSALKRGEIKAVVGATGKGTFFGKAAGMINSVQSEGHLAKVLLSITVVLLILSIVLCAVIFAKLMTTPDPAGYVREAGKSKTIESISVVIVILVASIPIAIEVVCTSTLAVGSHVMSRNKVIVARLSAIEELAGMTILCSDKTGTLTLNKLSLRDPIILTPGMTPQDVTFYAALASKRAHGNQDAIDLCITQAIPEGPERERMAAFKELDFMPFNPTDKRTEATVMGPDGVTFKVTKGAPQVVLRMVHNAGELRERVNGSVQELADRGFRALGVARTRPGPGPGPGPGPETQWPDAQWAGAISYTGPSEPAQWEYMGVLSLFDPPRHDTKATIAAAIDNGIEVKMVTGDQTAIAKETCRELGMGTNILNTEVLNDPAVPKELLARIIMEAHGFAEVMPEHKFEIVEAVRKMGHVTGMTGDGVNDAPALKRADIGIAVHGATDAARAAADIVLTEPGLSVIIDAILESRKIFQRMRNYIIYRIACTIQLLCFFFFASIAIDPDHPAAYNKVYDEGHMHHTPQFTIPVISLVIITILNDGCMITISKDRVVAEKRPQKWAMREIWVVALVLGFVACLSSLLMLAYMLQANALHRGDFWGHVFGSSGRDYLLFEEIRAIIYLKISVSDFLTLFSARTRTWFWERSTGWELTLAAFVATSASTLFALFWHDFVKVEDAPMASLYHSNGAAAATWLYCILWWFAQDAAKIGTYAMLDFLKPAAEKDVETFARRHSAEYLDRAPPSAHHSQEQMPPAGELLPQGTDLTALALAVARAGAGNSVGAKAVVGGAAGPTTTATPSSSSGSASSASAEAV